MKLLVFVALFLSAKALDANGKQRVFTVDERFLKVEDRMAKIETSLEAILQSLQSLQTKAEIEKPELKHDDNIQEKKSHMHKMKDSDLESRVQVLEFQMTEVKGDVTDVETQVTGVQAEQIIQDQRILELETETNELETNVNSLISSDLSIISSIYLLNQTLQASVSGLESRLDELESLDVASELSNLNSRLTELELLDVASELNNLNSRLNELESLDVASELSNLNSRLNELESLDVESELSKLNSRLNELELEGSVAFRVAFSEYNPIINENTVAVFDQIHMNPGGGYNSLTGEFTVPRGKGGLYYISTHMMIDIDEESGFVLRHNGDRVCIAYDDGRSGMLGGSGCGAVLQLQEGDVVDVYVTFTISDQPVLGVGYRTAFTGIRIAPQ